jgi:hypothetical protein
MRIVHTSALQEELGAPAHSIYRFLQPDPIASARSVTSSTSYTYNAALLFGVAVARYRQKHVVYMCV